MRVLQVSSNSDCYLTGCIFSGLSELLGQDSVFVAYDNPNHRPGAGSNPYVRIIEGNRTNLMGDEGDFDVMVVHSCFTRDYPQNYVAGLLGRLKPGARIAWIEGWDYAHDWHDPAAYGIKPTACFRRELDPAYHHYPYHAHCLMFAAPKRWFCLTDHERPIDVFYAANITSQSRWDSLQAMWQTKTRHSSVGASRGIGFTEYFEHLRLSKLAIDPVGAAECDSLRTWEAVACGAIPIFVGYPAYKREPWFENLNAGFCKAAELPNMLDWMLSPSTDLPAKRRNLQEHALKHHTTLARCEYMMKVLGV